MQEIFADNQIGITAEIVDFFYSNASSMPKVNYLPLIITSIWSTSSLFVHLLNIGELIFAVKQRPFRFFKRTTAIIMVFVVMFGLVLTFFLLFLLIFVFGKSAILYGLFLYFLLPLLAISLVHFVTIPRKINIIKDYKGILISYFFSLFATIGFTIFLKVFVNFKAIYGVLSFIISIMFLTYLISQGLIVGMIYNYKKYH